MRNRGLLAIAAIVAVVAVGGIGFAAFTTSAYINGYSTAGTLGPLTWSNVGTPVGTSSYNGCWVGTANHTDSGSTQDTLLISATNLAPGDQCTFTADLNNLGSIPANVYSQVTCVYPAGECLEFTYWDTIAPAPNGYDVSGGPFGPVTVAADGYIPYTGTLGLAAGLGNYAQGWTCEFEITLSATAGT